MLRLEALPACSVHSFLLTLSLWNGRLVLELDTASPRAPIRWLRSVPGARVCDMVEGCGSGRGGRTAPPLPPSGHEAWLGGPLCSKAGSRQGLRVLRDQLKDHRSMRLISNCDHRQPLVTSTLMA